MTTTTSSSANISSGDPDDTTPGDSAPGYTTPGDRTPGDRTPENTVTGDTVLGDSVPGDSVPGDSVPGDSVPGRPVKRWVPRRLLVTRSAYGFAHGRSIVERCEAAGVPEIELLKTDRLPSLTGDTYAAAKNTLAVTVAPPSKRKLQPIPPSADWRFDLAEGCPAHCQYCYLAGSLSGPPITRVYANLEEILAGLDAAVGQGSITSRSRARSEEGTTFEASCYTDPLALEHVTGSLSAAVQHFGTHDWPGEVQLRFTTKFDDVEPLLNIDHRGRTRVRVSVNVAEQFEGGTAKVAARLAAARRLALAGYPVGLTIAPIMPVDNWFEAYDALLSDAGRELGDAPHLDLTVECITHRFTPGSKETLLGWYPRTKLDFDEDNRAEKRNKFGGVKFVYPKGTMGELRSGVTGLVEQHLPAARLLYWT